MINQGKKNLLGVLVDAVDYEWAVSRIMRAARTHEPFSVTALAVHGLMTGVQDPCFRYRLNHLDLVVPDGQWVRWSLDWIYHSNLPGRVYGPNLMLKVCEQAAREGLPVYFYGSRENVIASLVEKLKIKLPDLIVAGCLPSLFRKATVAEKESIIQHIRDSGAAITFVGLGCPRQEVWAYEFTSNLDQPALAVGAAFDFNAGLLPQAPDWIQNLGFEWLFRLLKEPRRLWRRYLILNPWFLSLLLQQKTTFRQFDPNDTTCPDREELFA